MAATRRRIVRSDRLCPRRRDAGLGQRLDPAIDQDADASTSTRWAAASKRGASWARSSPPTDAGQARRRYPGAALRHAAARSIRRRSTGPWRRVKWLIARVSASGSTTRSRWLRWDRGPDAPDQAVLVDLANGRLFFFCIEIWPQEFYFVTGLLVLARDRPVPGHRAVRPASGAASPARRRSGPTCSCGSSA